MRLKLASVRAFGAQLIVKLRGVPAQSPLSRVVAEIIDAWACARGLSTSARTARRSSSRRQTRTRLPGWVRYLLAFDVKYRERRLHFLIEGQNRLYDMLDQERFGGLDPLVVDRLKREFYAPPRRAARGATDADYLQRRACARWWRRYFPPCRRPSEVEEPAELCALIRGSSISTSSTG